MTVVSFSEGKGSLNAVHKIQLSENSRTDSIRKIASSQRIEKTSDSVADAAIGTKIKIETESLKQILIASTQSLSTLEIADGNLTEMKNDLTRMKTLTIQALNTQLTPNDREKINNEFQELKKEVDRIARSTSFNEKLLLNGSSSIEKDSFNEIDNTVVGFEPLRKHYLTADMVEGGGFESIEFDEDLDDSAISVSYNAETKKMKLTNLNTGNSEEVPVSSDEIGYGVTEKLRFSNLKAYVNINSNFDKETSFGAEFADINISSNINNDLINQVVKIEKDGTDFDPGIRYILTPEKSPTSNTTYKTVTGQTYSLGSDKYIDDDGIVRKASDGTEIADAPKILVNKLKETKVPQQDIFNKFTRVDQDGAMFIVDNGKTGADYEYTEVPLEKVVKDGIVYIDQDGYVRFSINNAIVAANKEKDGKQRGINLNALYGINNASTNDADKYDKKITAELKVIQNPTDKTLDQVFDDECFKAANADSVNIKDVSKNFDTNGKNFTTTPDEGMAVKMRNVTREFPEITNVSGKTTDLKSFNIVAKGTYGKAYFTIDAEDGEFRSVKPYNLTKNQHDSKVSDDGLAEDRLTQGDHEIKFRRKIIENGEERVDEITLKIEILRNSDIVVRDTDIVDGKAALPIDGANFITLNSLKNTILLYKKTTDSAIFEFQVGTKNNDYDRITMRLDAVNTKRLGLDADDIRLTTTDRNQLQKVSDVVDAAINKIVNVQSTVAITFNRIQATNSSIQVNINNSQLATSAIFDLDIPSEMAALSQYELQQAAALDTLSRDIKSKNNLQKLFG